jgi:N12 class adenine-specific DNA methylase
MPEDLRTYVKVPEISTGKRQIITAEADAGLQDLSAHLDPHQGDREARGAATAR